MATTKKSTTKAKTKTAAKKTTRKTTSKKVTRSKKPAAVSASSKTTTNKLLTTKILQRLQVATGVLYLLLIAPVVLLMQEKIMAVTMPYMTDDPLDAGGVLAPAVRQMYAIDLRWLLIALLAVSALFCVLYATRLKDFYNRNIQKKQLWSRWLEIAIVGGLMLEVVALLSGWQTIIELKFGWVAVAFLAYVGYKQEKYASEDGVQFREFSVAGVLLKFILAIAFITTAVTTYIWGMTTNPWYVYALYGVLAVFFILFARHFKRAVDAPALVVERNFIILSALVRTVFVAVLVAGLIK